MSVHVCIVNCLHPPDDVRVVQKVARALREASMQVSWVGPGPEPAARSLEPGLQYHFFEPGRGRLGRLLRNHRAAFALANALPRADVYMGVEPDSAAMAVRLARLKGARAVFDVHEPYDDEVLVPWVPPMMRRSLSLVVRSALLRICERSDLVIGVNQSVLAPYVSVGTPKLVIRSCAPASFADGPPADVCAPGRAAFTLVQGKATVTHGTEVVIRALGIAARRMPRLRGVFFDTFDQTGPGFTRADFDAMVREAGAEGAVDLRPRVRMAEMPGVLRGSDVGLISYDRTWGVKSLPNKLFEFMAVGLPIVAPTYAREITPIIEAERCGILVDCERPEEIANAIIHLESHPDEARDMGRRARAAFLARHNFQSEITPLIDIILDWAEPNRPAGHRERRGTASHAVITANGGAS
jgi:glycosyltransferase involved in cell wall biosynthesis